MKKILMGLIGIALIAGVTTATGYAVFTATATVNNVAFTTGNADVQFSRSVNGPWTNSYTFPTYLVTNVFPGYTTGTQIIYVKNNSLSAINLAFSAQLVSASGAWDDLKSVAFMSINGVSGPLVDWNGADVPLNFTLGAGVSTPVQVVFSIDHGAGNSISGKSLITNWTITGTQTP